ncbi:MAG: GTP cyclohydrolase I FolE, partial [Flavobacteriales bacterium]|nr:GTP cyclohydrolase I FolE [Flavobacteriales bacterium]
MNDHMRDDDINHHSTSLKTPLTADAFVKSDEEKIDLIEGHFQGIMKTLGLDLEDDSLKGTPHRVAKMYVTETFGGLHPDRKPALNTFENSYQYSEMLVEKNIVVYSTCEHHFMPIIGRAHIAYMSND